MATKLDLADAQFIGYHHGRFGSLIEMVNAMGLTKKEWLQLKKRYPQLPYLREMEVEEIDKHFKL